MSVNQRKTAKTKLVISTTTVVATTSSRDGKDTFRISRRVSARKSLIFLNQLFMSPSSPRRLESGEIGRPGGIQTPNPRFWRPMLYQFELLACFYRLFLPLCFPACCDLVTHLSLKSQVHDLRRPRTSRAVRPPTSPIG